MKFMLAAILPVVLAAQGDKVYYLSKVGVSCSTHSESGVTNCVQGQVHDAETLDIDPPKLSKRIHSCDITIPDSPFSTCSLSCARQFCGRSYCAQGVCHCSEC